MFHCFLWPQAHEDRGLALSCLPSFFWFSSWFSCFSCFYCFSFFSCFSFFCFSIPPIWRNCEMELLNFTFMVNYYDRCHRISPVYTQSNHGPPQQNIWCRKMFLKIAKSLGNEGGKQQEEWTRVLPTTTTKLNPPKFDLFFLGFLFLRVGWHAVSRWCLYWGTAVCTVQEKYRHGEPGHPITPHRCDASAT